MSAWSKQRIVEADETGLGRIIHEGRFYGVPIPVLDYIAEIEQQRDELLDGLKLAQQSLGRYLSGEEPGQEDFDNGDVIGLVMEGKS